MFWTFNSAVEECLLCHYQCFVCTLQLDLGTLCPKLNSLYLVTDWPSEDYSVLSAISACFIPAECRVFFTAENRSDIFFRRKNEWDDVCYETNGREVIIRSSIPLVSRRVLTETIIKWLSISQYSTLKCLLKVLGHACHIMLFFPFSVTTLRAYLFPLPKQICTSLTHLKITALTVGRLFKRCVHIGLRAGMTSEFYRNSFLELLFSLLISSVLLSVKMYVKNVEEQNGSE